MIKLVHVEKNNTIYRCQYAGYDNNKKEKFKCGYCRRGNVVIPNFRGEKSGCKICKATIFRVITDKWEIREKNGNIIRTPLYHL